MMRAFIRTATETRECAVSELEALGDDVLIWVHLDGRDAKALTWLSTQHGRVPELALSALTAVETRPRCDEIEHGVLLNLRGLGKTPEDDPDPLVSMRLWVEEKRVISLTYRQPLFLEPVVATMLSGKVEDPGDLVSALADTITSQLNPHIADLGDELDGCEVRLESGSLFSMRRKVSAARSTAISYRRFVTPQRQALENLAIAGQPWLDEHDRMHLREAADRAARMAEELESVRERAAVMHDQLTDMRAEQIDSRALLVSIIALIFLPLTFITGLLGMNVKGIPYAEEAWAFWGVVLFCIVTGVLVGAYFIRAHWISRG